MNHSRRPLRIALIVIAAAALVAVFHRPLISWFTGGDSSGGNGRGAVVVVPGADAGTASSKADAPTAPPPLEPLELPPKALGALQEAMSALDRVRAKLAADSLDGVAEPAARVATMMRDAAALVTAEDVRPRLREAADAAGELERASDAETARKHFSVVSKTLTALAAADPRLQEGWMIFECPMVGDFNKWLQRGDALENPYMGKKMLTCGSPSTFTVPVASLTEQHDEHGEHAGDADEVEYYTCSMHPSVKQEQPGNCPICGMALTPVTKGELRSGIVLVDDIRRQKIGVKTARVEMRSVAATITTVGRVVYDEKKLHDVALKIGGFVEELFVDQTGQKVTAGQPLFLLYSPALYAAQVEYLQALKTPKALERSDFAGVLISSAKRRLELWGLSEKQIENLVARGEASDRMPILSPASGYVIEKNVVKGTRVDEGATVYRIAGLDEIWIEADVYEADLPKVQVGQRASVTLTYLPGKELGGKVTFIYPFLDGVTRTGRVRVALKNPGLELKPQMYANVTLHANEAMQLVVPESAVIYAGPRRLVFVDLGEGRLKPAEVRLGKKSGDVFEVLDGIKEGDVVVTSGNFLIAAESRLKGATAYWAQDDERATASSPPLPAPTPSTPTAPTPPTGSIALDVTLQTDPPPQRGSVVVVDVRDARGRPVTSAEVRVEYRMPAMGAMAEMKGEAKIEPQRGGRSIARFDLPMGGTWTLTTHVSSPQGSVVATHSLTVGKKGLTPQGATATGGHDERR